MSVFGMVGRSNPHVGQGAVWKRGRRSPVWLTVVTTAALGATIIASASPSSAAPPSGTLAPIHPGHGHVVPGRYIVVLQPGSDPAAVARRNGAAPTFVYNSTITGFAAGLSRGQLAQLQRDRSVKYIDPDGIATINDKPAPPPSSLPAPTGPNPTTQTGPTTSATQNGATWGIDRIDQATGTDGTYNYTNKGTGVTAYVIDTGIYTAHAQFSGRASVGYDAIGDGQNGQDCNGHGTHVSGTIGGKTFGVAKGVKLVAVRVLDCTGHGSWSQVIAGVDWVTYNHNGPSVANMSLGGGFTQSLNDSVSASIARGVTYVVAAGNDGNDSCNYSPSSTPTALTVSATDSTDTRPSWADYGSCVDVFDPGVNIKSAWIGSTTATNTISGTSMATPHVAGQVALYLQSNPSATPATVADVLLTDAVSGTVQNPGSGSPNLLERKWNGFLSATGADSYQPDGMYWYQANSGYIQGWLAGTGGTGNDPDLYLQQWNGSAWVDVAWSASTTPKERIVYQAPGGYYYCFRVHSYSGSGSYDLWSYHPA